jgi:hypothetical protein
VHEHWNNATDKKYSRNLGLGKGIELVTIAAGAPSPASFVPPAEASPLTASIHP